MEGEPRYMARWEGLNPQLGHVKCTALLWKSNLADDLLHPGMLPLTWYRTTIYYTTTTPTTILLLLKSQYLM